MRFSHGDLCMSALLTRMTSISGRVATILAATTALVAAAATDAMARTAPEGGEANLKLPDLSQVQFLGVDGHKLLLFGIFFCIFGLVFGLTIYTRLKHLPVHRSMR